MTSQTTEKTAPLDPALFRPDAIAPDTRAFVDTLIAQTRQRTGALSQGASSMPRPPQSDRARTRTVRAADGREVSVRILAPDSPQGVYLHLHPGGLVMGSADGQDAMLERIARATGLACVSVEYRLAPAHPYPAAWDDCEAVAVWLARSAKAEFGSERLAIGGESAGATLAVPVLVRMRDKHGFTGFRAANLSYGNYDTSMTPSQKRIGALGVLLRTSDIEGCSDAYCPDRSKRRDPDVSALYADLERLPPALLSVGTLDPFLDDSLFLYSRWIAAGNDAQLAIYPGAPHGFNLFPLRIGAEANVRIDAFLKAAMLG
ncbi:MAG: alpha/beta hydrolase [Steroidobacteraceae bacterium]